ncbi:hypothetical protein [Phenylobacterium sp.]|jgi:hypothetical protein|uniref:hypothetical protein n=1 Tax=Phenylobacterium sp. TaxID=1871053 RepID=UPI0037CC5086
MLDALNITEEEALGLAEIAQHDLALARDFARRAQAAADSEEANQLARSYQRAARSYRQTLALKARLRRDLAIAAQAVAATPRAKPSGAAVERRVGELREALLRMAWNEAERPEDERAETGDVEPDVEMFALRRHDVEFVIAEACLKNDFCEEPLDDHIARLAVDMDFAPSAIGRWRDMPDPPASAFEVESMADQWLSSA